MEARPLATALSTCPAALSFWTALATLAAILAGHFINLSGGIFLLDGSGNFGGNTDWTFNNLTLGDGSGNQTTTLSGSGLITANGDLIVNNNQTLQGSKDVIVNGGSATGNGTINLSGSTFTLDGTGNFGGDTDWNFYNLTFGDGIGGQTSSKTGNGTTTITNILTISPSQTMKASSTVWILSGAGTPFVVNGNFTAQESLFRYIATSDATTTATTYYQLEIVPGPGSPTFIMGVGTLATNDYLHIGDGSNAVTVTANDNDPVLDINGDFETRNNATFTASDQSSFTLAGSWLNSGTFNHSSATTTFDANTTGHTINLGSSVFYNIEFNSLSGGWTITNDATSTNNWSITNAASFSASSSVTVLGEYIISDSIPAITTWGANSILYLDSGSSYTVGSKNQNPESYYALKVGADTDIKIWNSTSTIYDINSSSSLYSMDHNNSNGSLYIWGDFHIASGTEYWSYSKDFDGMAGANRQARVYLAQNATTTVDGGELQILGIASATTTMANQGASTYGLVITEGTINASYYQIRNINDDGLNLSGNLTVTSLDYGDYELGIEGGTMMTVASSTIDANSGLTITGCRFATSTGISSGYNVTRIGTSSSYWRFSSHWGNYDGELYDNDLPADCGSIRWGNSTCPTTIEQSHYRWRNDDEGEGSPWWDDAWPYRKRITIASSSGAGTNYQVKLIVGYSSGGDLICDSHCQTDFDDIRFTDGDGTNLLDYWRESYIVSATSTFWVEVQDNLGSDKDIIMYYGNLTANTASNGTTTFIFFDDFFGSSLDTNKWDTTSGNPPTTYSVGSGYLKMWDNWGSCCNASCVYDRLNTKESFSGPIAVETRFSITGTDAIGTTNICYHTVFGNRDVAGISSGADGSVFRINTATDLNNYTYPAKDSWYRVTKIFESNQLQTITNYGINESFAGSVISSGPIGVAGDTDANEANMSDRVDWIAVRKYVSPEPSFSSTGSESASSTGGATWKAAEDIAVSGQATDENIRVRFTVKNTGDADSSGLKYRLQAASQGGYGDCASVPTLDFSDMPTTPGSAVAVMATSTHFTDQDITSRQLSTEGAWTNGKMVEHSSQESDVIVLALGEFSEVEYNFKFTSNAVKGQAYCLRVVKDGADMDSYAQIAAITMINPTVSGHAYADGGGTVWSGCNDATSSISLVVNGNFIASTTCAAGTGYFEFKDVALSADEPVSVFINTNGGNTDKGAVITRAAGSVDDISLALRKDRVWLTTEGGSSNITNIVLNHCDANGLSECANIPYAVSAGNLIVDSSAKLIIGSNKTFTPGGQVTLSSGYASSSPGGDIEIESGAKFDAQTYDVWVGGDWISKGQYYSDSAQTVTFTATSTGYTIDPNGYVFGNIVFNGAGGGWSFIDNVTLNRDLTITAGTLIGTSSITVNGGDVTGNGTINLSGGTFLVDESGNFGGNNSWTFYNLTFGDGNNIRTTVKTGSGSITASGTLTIASNQTLNAGTQSWITGSLVNNGIFTTNGTQIIYVSGSWDSTSGTFNAANSTVEFTSTGSGNTITSGGQLFYNLHFSGVGGEWTFVDNATSTATTTISAGTLIHGADNNLVMRNLVIVNGGGFTKAAGAGKLIFEGAEPSIFEDNNTIPNNLGNVQIGYSPATTNLNSDFAADSLTVNSDDIFNTCGYEVDVTNYITIHGTYDCTDTGESDGTITTLGTDWTVDTAGIFIADTSTTTFDGASSSFLNSGGTDDNHDFNHLTFAKSAATSTTLSGYNLKVSGDIIIGANSIFDVSTNNYHIYAGGSWKNSGTFTARQATTTFDAIAAGKNIDSGDSPFYNIEFKNNSGGWTILDNATSTNDWWIASATSFTVNSGVIIEVQGEYIVTNNVPTNTTWNSGATLYLNSSSVYLVGSKNQTAEDYAILKIGPDTDIKMWNSSSTVYQVNPSGSLYSMDHNNQNGWLYIFGDYHLGSGQIDYWSYATDFDGTVGANRQVRVYLDANATTIVDGGTLNIIGVASATTTITHQSTGTYTLAVTSGTLYANYYQIRDIDIDGLNIAGSPTITSLDYGDFELEINNGSMITIASSVITANPYSTTTGCRFATSTGISSGHNVTLNGIPSNDWYFINHWGNLAGEDFDSDPGDPRGYLVWDDSPSYTPKSQNWQWFHEENDPTPTSSPAAAENFAPSTIGPNNTLKLRMTIAETGGVMGENVKMKLQYATSSDFSQNVYYVGEIGSTTAVWTYDDGIDNDNATITERILSDSTANATHNESGTSGSNYDHVANIPVEWEFTIYNNGAATSTVYYFRAYSSYFSICHNYEKVVPINDGESYPSLSVSLSTLTYVVAGLPANTNTEGIMTDIDTTATEVPFGSLSFGSQTEGAQRFTIATNAENGYQLFVYQRQNLLCNTGADIDPLSTTNESPASWTIGSNPGGFGYHSGDDTLTDIGDGPARFSPINTYAKFEIAPKEVSYSSIPVDDEIIDLVFKIEVTNQQEAGDYETEVVYILVPTF